MNLFKKQKNSTLIKRNYSYQGRAGGKRQLWSLGSTGTHTAIFKMGANITQETLLNGMWQPGWEESLGENGYMRIYMGR